MFLGRLNYGNDLGCPVTLAWGGAKRLGGGAKGTLGKTEDRPRAAERRCDRAFARRGTPTPGLCSGFPCSRAPMGAPAPRVPAPALCLLLACARLSWGEPAGEPLEVPALGKRGVD